MMCRLLDILLALLSRVLFAVHGIVTVWRVAVVKDEQLYWLLLMGVALLGVEMIVTLKWTRNAEWKWFSPMVFLYLCTVVPSIWILELCLVDCNPKPNPSHNNSAKANFLDQIPIKVNISSMEPKDWANNLEQSMMIVLVLGRWLMPKGEMSRDQLSQLLMVYLGLGADILDIFAAFRETAVKINQPVVIVGLALFSLALMQFPLVRTNSSQPLKDDTPHGSRRWLHCCQGLPSFPSCCYSEVWSLLLTVGLQDAPFLVYRLYLIVEHKVYNQLFFTCKNILVVLLEVYRIFVVQFEPQLRELVMEKCDAEAQRSSEEEEQEVEEGHHAEQSCYTNTEMATDGEENHSAVLYECPEE